MSTAAATAKMGYNMVPREFNKSLFMATAWFYLKDNPNLTLSQLHQLGHKNKDNPAKTCKPEVFEDVKQKMALQAAMNGALSNASAEEKSEFGRRPEARIQHYVPYTRSGPSKKIPKSEWRPNNEETRKTALKWIRENLQEGYSGFKHHWPENFLNASFFDDCVRRIQREKSDAEHKAAVVEVAGKETAVKPTEPAAPPPMRSTHEGEGMAQLENNPRLSDSARIMEYLKTLSAEDFSGMRAADYRKLMRHKVTDSTFNSAKYRVKVMRAEKGAEEAPRSRRSRAAPSEPLFHLTGQNLRVMGEISLADLEPDKRAFAQEMVKKTALVLMGDRAKVVQIANPPAIEIRLPFV